MYNYSLRNRIAVFFAAACFLSSCGNETVYSEFQPVKDKLWDKNNEYFFDFEIKDISIPYNVSLQLRNNDMYPYQNIWILFEESKSAGYSVKDTIEYLLADDFGKWKANGISLYQNRIPIKTRYIFPDTGKYTINIRHGMRDDKLKGIENIGIHIEFAK